MEMHKLIMESTLIVKLFPPRFHSGKHFSNLNLRICIVFDLAEGRRGQCPYFSRPLFELADENYD